VVLVANAVVCNGPDTHNERCRIIAPSNNGLPVVDCSEQVS